MTTETITIESMFNAGLLVGYPIVDRVHVSDLYRKHVGRTPKAKHEIDAFVMPLVEQGTLLIHGYEQIIKGCPGGASRPATAKLVDYRLTAKGKAALAEWVRANPEAAAKLIPPYTLKSFFK